MKTFLADLAGRWDARPFVWSVPPGGIDGGVRPPRSATVLCLAPHPDDAESAAVTLGLLGREGCSIFIAVAFLSPEGVDDDFARGAAASRPGHALPDVKAGLRRGEQIRSAELFGLAPDRLAFLGLEGCEHPGGVRSAARVEAHLVAVDPDVVVLPCGRDTNRTHAWVWEAFRRAAGPLALRRRRPIVALCNEDPKTVEMREDLYVRFDEATAAWKRTLLLAHASQQHRNLRARGIGFDERILGVNREAAGRLSRAGGPPQHGARPYAEVFELEVFGSNEGGAPWTTCKPS